MLLFCFKMSGFFVWFCAETVLNSQSHDAAFYGLQSFTFPHSCNTSSSGLLPLLLRTCTWWHELLHISHVISLFQCLKLPAHDRQRWRAISSTDCITKMFQISEAFLHLREILCIFRDVLTTGRFHTVSISHTHMVALCWFTKKLCLIFQSWNYAALILNTFYSFLSLSCDWG